MLERGEEERVESRVRRARRVGSEIRDVSKTQLRDVNRNVVCRVIGEVVANDAMRGRGTEVIGEEGAPRDGGVDGGQNLVHRFLLKRVKNGLLLLLRNNPRRH